MLIPPLRIASREAFTYASVVRPKKWLNRVKNKPSRQRDAFRGRSSNAQTAGLSGEEARSTGESKSEGSQERERPAQRHGQRTQRNEIRMPPFQEDEHDHDHEQHHRDESCRALVDPGSDGLGGAEGVAVSQ